MYIDRASKTNFSNSKFTDWRSEIFNCNLSVQVFKPFILQVLINVVYQVLWLNQFNGPLLSWSNGSWISNYLCNSAYQH